MAEIQEEILWVCEAAHMPVVWATQVLESLAKKGLPSRAEITDAAMGQRAECVMLNKRPYLCDPVQALDDILSGCRTIRSRKARCSEGAGKLAGVWSRSFLRGVSNLELNGADRRRILELSRWPSRLQPRSRQRT